MRLAAVTRTERFDLDRDRLLRSWSCRPTKHERPAAVCSQLRVGDCELPALPARRQTAQTANERQDEGGVVIHMQGFFHQPQLSRPVV